jgi:hypothetical protein
MFGDRMVTELVGARERLDTVRFLSAYHGRRNEALPYRRVWCSTASAISPAEVFDDSNLTAREIASFFYARYQQRAGCIPAIPALVFALFICAD